MGEVNYTPAAQPFDISKSAAGWADKADRWLGITVDVVTAGLILFETGLLFVNIVARYVFHSPLIWADELASYLFLWLALLGTTIAFRRGSHMRMTALVNLLPQRYTNFFDVIALGFGIVFMLMILPPSIELMVEESFITSPAMQIPMSYRAMALPVCCVLMLIFGLLRLVRSDGHKATFAALAIIAGIVAVFHFLGPFLAPLGNGNLLVFFVGVVGVSIFAGIPIAFAFGLASYGYVSTATFAPTLIIVARINEGMTHLILLAVPLFVFLGLLIEMTGMARAMVQFLANLLGHVRGGLAYVLVGAMYLVSGISGAKAADMAAVAPVLFPEMQKRGAKPGELVALLSATGAQTETVPPSLVLITVGSVTGVSIASLFTGGLLPSVVLGILLCVLVGYKSRNEDMSRVKKANWNEIGKSLVIALPALTLPFVIRFAVVEGIATATEVSTIGIAYSVVVGLLIYRQFDFRKLLPILVETASLSGAILLIIGTATAMGWGLTQSGFSQSLAAAMAALPGGGWTFIFVSIVTFAILGSILEGIPAIVLFGPLLFPIAKSFGVNEVHYSMVVILSMGLGLFAPPLGVGYYTACAIGRVSPDEAMRSIWSYMLVLAIGVLIVALVPWISTGLL